MKVKTNFKFFLIFGVMLGIMLLLGTTKVQATCYGIVTEGTATSNSLDSIENTISVDLKESEFEQADKYIYNQIVTELEKQGIKISESEYTNENTCLSIYISSSELKKASIVLNKNSNTVAEKIVNVIYNNSSNYNENDKKYVESLINNYPYKYLNYWNSNGYDVCFIEKDVELGEKWLYNTDDTKLNKRLQELTSTKLSFKYQVGGAGGGWDGFSEIGVPVGYGVFYNDILYDTINIFPYTYEKITISNDIEDTEIAYINYAIPKIKEYLKTNAPEYSNGTITLEKISGYWYKVFINSQDFGKIILKKAEGTFIGNNIFVDNLVEGANITVTPTQNETLENELKNNGYSNIIGSYELTLSGVNKLTNPIDITFNVGSEYNGKSIYILHQKKNGTNETFEETISNGKVTIKVSELSPFVLGLKEDKKDETPTTPNAPTQTTTPTTTTNKEKDETPKTGTIDIIGYVGIVTLISTLGIIILRKRIK